MRFPPISIAIRPSADSRPRASSRSSRPRSMKTGPTNDSPKRCATSKRATRHTSSKHQHDGDDMVTSTIGRRIRLGLIGGGPGSIIGETHRIAARLDGHYDIVAAALSSDPERARQAALEIGIDEERAYASWQQMLDAEAARPDRIDAVAVMTPNDSHYAICMMALDRGFHVICDKPLANELAQAREIAARVKQTHAEFCVTYCYS